MRLYAELVEGDADRNKPIQVIAHRGLRTQLEQHRDCAAETLLARLNRPRRRDSLLVTYRHTPPILNGSWCSTRRIEEVVGALAGVVRVLHDGGRARRRIRQVARYTVGPAQGAPASVAPPAAPPSGIAVVVARILTGFPVGVDIGPRRRLTTSDLAFLAAASRREREQGNSQRGRQNRCTHCISPRKDE